MEAAVGRLECPGTKITVPSTDEVDSIGTSDPAPSSLSYPIVAFTVLLLAGLIAAVDTAPTEADAVVGECKECKEAERDSGVAPGLILERETVATA
jgi:hypothetical protein